MVERLAVNEMVACSSHAPGAMIIRKKTSLESLGSFVKVVIDIKREIISADCELHVDCAEELMADGSLYANLWGANIYPRDKKIDFIALINIRPAEGNRSMEIENTTVRKRVEDIIKKLLF